MDQPRPDPDELLARVQAETAKTEQGKLKVFFGGAAGVGKTYGMLEAAHDRQTAGVDVVVGWIDTHSRAETEALLAGLEVLPRRAVDYRGATLWEFDLDAALRRRPTLLLIDELAHTNAPDCRHAKRWQDVEEVLQAGIDVYTTVNIQHLESLNDVVAQITGVVVQETIPDSTLEQADDVELIDLPPDELLHRLREGKVYISHQAERAIQNFFRKGNLIALRELALRRTADRVDAQMQDYRRDHAIGPTWPTVERVLVCVSPSPFAPHLVRAARRMVAGLRAEWMVVYVETPRHAQLKATARERVVETLRLAEQLGAETVTLSGARVSEEILAYARHRNVTKIVVGKPTHPHWRDVVFGSMLDDLIRQSGDIDIYVITGEESEPQAPARRFPARTSPWSAYVYSAAVVLACTGLAQFVHPRFAEANLVMIYLLGVVVVATRFGRGPAVMASILSVAAFDFFFVPPFYTFAVAHVQYLITFAIMLTVALITSTLTVRLRLQAHNARDRERRTATINALTRDLANLAAVPALLEAAVHHISAVFGTQVAALMPTSEQRLVIQAAAPNPIDLDNSEMGVAQWVYEHGAMAGAGATTLPGAEALYLPLAGARRTVGVLSIYPLDAGRLWTPEQLHFLETLAGQTAIAVERTLLAAETERAQVQIKTEQLRNTLLSSVSHDLRTPLAAITGAASSLLDNSLDDAPNTRRELLQTIYEEGDRLNRLVGNLLQMTRLESGNLVVHKEWQPIEEVIGSALARLEPQLAEHIVTTHLPPELLMLPFDSVLIEQTLVNLLENAAKYTPPHTEIEICVEVNDDVATLSVNDQGPGLPPGDEPRVFEKFYRGDQAGRPSGVGLGLAICRAIVEAHGGRIWAENRSGGGARFAFTLPLDGAAPALQPGMAETVPAPRADEPLEDEPRTSQSRRWAYR